jgi:hypothetical protein
MPYSSLSLPSTLLVATGVFLVFHLLTMSTTCAQLQSSATIATVAEGLSLTLLVSALNAAGGPLLTTATNSSSTVTVFAPTDVVRSPQYLPGFCDETASGGFELSRPARLFFSLRMLGRTPTYWLQHM